MSTPTKLNGSPVGAKEGQRVILREITASLHNSPPTMAHNNKNVNDTVTKEPPEHEVKVKFAREFGDVESYPPSIPKIVVDSSRISAASSFQSLTSTLSTKSSSGICADSPTRSSEISHTNVDALDLDDLISACAAIHLDDSSVTTAEQSFGDVTFTSATDDLSQTENLSRPISPNAEFNNTEIIPTNLNSTTVISEQLSFNLNSDQDINCENIDNSCSDTSEKTPCVSPISTIAVNKEELNGTFAVTLPSEVSSAYTELVTNTDEVEESQSEQLIKNVLDASLCLQSSTLPTLSNSLLTAEFTSDCASTIIDENFCLETSQHHIKEIISETSQITSVECASPANILQSIPDISTSNFVAINDLATQSISIQPDTSKKDYEISIKEVTKDENELPIEVVLKQPISENLNNQLNTSASERIDSIQTEPISIAVTKQQETDTKNFEELDTTLNINISNITDNLFDATEADQYGNLLPQNEKIETHTEKFAPVPDEYTKFLPSRQSTNLTDLLPPPPPSSPLPHINNELSSVGSTGTSEPEFFDAQNTSTSENLVDFEELKLDEENIVNDICNTSLELVDDNDRLASASSDLWRDPTNFDFLLSKKSNSATIDRLRAESLYVKFDPLVSDTNMLPQGNGATAPPNEERNGEKETAVTNIGTPKRNPAIAAIDRLLFYSPMSPAHQKSEEPIKIEPTEKTTPEPIPVVDTVMAKELELVRATVLQLEEQLEKQKLEREQLEKEHKVDCEAFQEAITQLQKQLNHEIKSKNQINVVVDEYEKSISRLVAERERDRKNLDVEKSSLLEELQEVKNHLAASEAAFNDVHAKYERLKVVVTASKNNEAALKASIAENVEIIKNLEDRYDQIKTHAAVRLEKANQELDSIRKQHESETLKFRAMLRKEELKSSSLAQMIEQKTKENKELTKILDEVIARVDSGTDN